MSVTLKAAKLLLNSAITIGGALGLIYTTQPPTPPSPTPVTQVQQEVRSPEFEKAFFQAATVYGKAGCGDQHLAEITAKHALAAGLPAAIVAAMAAAESTCNPLAVSNRGAVGLTQVVPKIWKDKYDFTKINLFNPDENLTVSTTILSGLVKQYGLKGGLRRYYGTGNDGIGLGGTGYADHVLALAGKV